MTVTSKYLQPISLLGSVYNRFCGAKITFFEEHECNNSCAQGCKLNNESLIKKIFNFLYEKFMDAFNYIQSYFLPKQQSLTSSMTEIASKFKDLLTSIFDCITSFFNFAGSTMSKLVRWQELFQDTITIIVSCLFVLILRYIFNVNENICKFIILGITLYTFKDKAKDMLDRFTSCLMSLLNRPPRQQAEESLITKILTYIPIAFQYAIPCLMFMLTGREFIKCNDTSSFFKKLATLPRSLTGIDVIKKYFKDIFNIILKYILPLLGINYEIPDEFQQIKDWMEEVGSLTADPRRKVKYGEEEYCKRVCTLYSRGVSLGSLFGDSKPPKEIQGTFTSCLRAAEKLSAEASASFGISGNIRREPTMFYFYGPSGQGKSNLLEPFSACLENDMPDVTAPMQEVYVRNYQQDFWDGYNRQKIVLIDDFGQMIEQAGTGLSQYLELIYLVNPFPFKLNMANLEQKANTFSRCEVVLCSSNIKDPGQHATAIVQKDAVTRRTTAMYEVIPDNDVLIKGPAGNKIVSTKKVYEKYGSEFSIEFYRFQQYKIDGRRIIDIGPLKTFGQVLHDMKEHMADKERAYRARVKTLNAMSRFGYEGSKDRETYMNAVDYTGEKEYILKEPSVVAPRVEETFKLLQKTAELEKKEYEWLEHFNNFIQQQQSFPLFDEKGIVCDNIRLPYNKTFVTPLNFQITTTDKYLQIQNIRYYKTDNVWSYVIQMKHVTHGRGAFDGETENKEHFNYPKFEVETIKLPQQQAEFTVHDEPLNVFQVLTRHLRNPYDLYLTPNAHSIALRHWFYSIMWSKNKLHLCDLAGGTLSGNMTPTEYQSLCRQYHNEYLTEEMFYKVMPYNKESNAFIKMLETRFVHNREYTNFNRQLYSFVHNFKITSNFDDDSSYDFQDVGAWYLYKKESLQQFYNRTLEFMPSFDHHLNFIKKTSRRFNVPEEFADKMYLQIKRYGIAQLDFSDITSIEYYKNYANRKWNNMMCTTYTNSKLPDELNFIVGLQQISLDKPNDILLRIDNFAAKHPLVCAFLSVIISILSIIIAFYTVKKIIQTTVTGFMRVYNYFFPSKSEEITIHQENHSTDDKNDRSLNNSRTNSKTDIRFENHSTDDKNDRSLNNSRTNSKTDIRFEAKPDITIHEDGRVTATQEFFDTITQVQCTIDIDSKNKVLADNLLSTSDETNNISDNSKIDKSTVIQESGDKTKNAIHRRLRIKDKRAPKQEGLLDENCHQIIENKIKPNMYKLCYHIPSTGNTYPLGSVIFIQGRVFMCPRHFLQIIRTRMDTYKEKPETIILSLHNSFLAQPYEFPFSAITDNITIHDKKDLILSVAPKLVRDHPSLIKFFLTDKEMNTSRFMPITLITMRNSKDKDFNFPLERHYYNTAERKDQVNIQEFTGDIITNFDIIQYHIDTTAGDCGAPVLLRNSNSVGKLLGIHCAGDAGIGYAQVITKQMILAAFDFYKEHNITAIPNIILPDSIDENCDIPLPQQGSFIPIGKSKYRNFENRTSAIIPSLFHGKLPFQPKTLPAALCSFRSVDGTIINPRIKAIEKTGRTPVFIDEKYFDEIKQDILTVLEMNCELTPDYERNILTFDEAVKGIDGNKYINSMPRMTSAGYDYKFQGHGTNKKYWLGYGEEVTLNTPQCLALKEDCLNTLNRLKNNDIYVDIVIDEMKDERRDPEKVKAGKTRVFNTSSMRKTIIGRQLFGKFNAMFMANRIGNESSVGINAYSEFDRLYHHIQSKGPYVVAGDFSNYDGTLSPQILKAIAEIINNWYNDSESNKLARINYMADIVFSHRLDGDTVYQVLSGQPSGNPLTVIINTLYNMFAIRLVYLHLAKPYRLDSMAFYHRFVSFQSYGDDNLINPHPSIIEWFNQQTITQAYWKYLGMIYTDETKQITDKNYKKIDEVAYLKRTFFWHPTLLKYVGQRKKEDIYETLNWQKKTSDKYQQLQDNVRQGAIEFGLHPKYVYDSFLKTMLKLFGEHNISKMWPDIPSYEFLVDKQPNPHELYLVKDIL